MTKTDEQMYTSEGSYAPVERVDFHTSTTAVTYSIEIIRDGAKPAPVHTTEEMPGKSFVTPLDASAKILGYEVDGVDFFGAGCMVVFTRNGGTVFNAGSCEWVNGLRLREPFTERITRNVLNKFSQR